MRNRKFRLCLNKFASKISIRVVTALQAYLKKTEILRGYEKYLFVTVRKPHHRASKQPISRWLRKVLEEAGIDVEIFKAHSTRPASVSKAKSNFVPVDDIIKVAGWTNNKCFKKFYDKTIIHA